jgi:ribose transport system substrate-binding protein
MVALVAIGSVAVGLVSGGSSLANTTHRADNVTGSAAQGGSVSINVGTRTIKVHGKPKIAFFGNTGNLYLTAYDNGLFAEAKKLGVSVTMYNASLDATTQFNQVQVALQQHKYDAFIIQSQDGVSQCHILSQQAPAAGVVVVTALTPICNRGINPEGDTLWQPGTLSQVQDDSTYTEDEGWINAVASHLSGHHTVALFNGPPLLTVSLAFTKAVAYGAKKYPNLSFAYNISTEESTSDCFTKAQTLLQAHPNIDAMLSVYSDCTIGILKAIQAAGRKAGNGGIKVFDIGGSHQSFAEVKAGKLVLTTYHTPYQNGVAAVKAVADAFAGKKVPHYIGIHGPGATAGHPLIIDSADVNKYKAEY